MSADNGIYVSRWLVNKEKPGQYEYRVVEAQSIANCDYKISTIPERVTQAYRVLYYGESKIYNTEKEAQDRAWELYKHIMADPTGILEYGICKINYDEEFPKMTVKEAYRVINNHWGWDDEE